MRHAPLPPQYAVWRLGPARFAGPDVPSGPVEWLLACRSLFVVAICAIVGQRNWPLFAPALFPKWRPAGALARCIAARCGPLAMPGKGWRRFLGHVAKALRPSGRGGWPWLRQPASPVLPPCCPHAAGSHVSARPARLRQCGSRFARQHNRAGGLGVGKGCLRVASGGKGRLGQKLTWNI